MTRARAVVLAGIVLCTFPVLAACSNAVLVSPKPVAADRAGCPQVLAALPDFVDGAKRRPITPESASAAAWGKTPIVLTCGVPQPRALTPTSELITVNGIDWFGQPLSKGYRFTTFGRSPRLQVDVPSTYQPETNALVDLSGTVNKHTRKSSEFGQD